MLYTREDVKQWLKDGGTIECSDCPKDIKDGDDWVFLAGYVFCKECYEDDEKY